MQTLIGIGVILCRDKKVLLGKRIGAHGAGTWALPGGHLDAGESITECAIREVMEETSIHIKSVEHAGFTDSYFVDNSHHYITLFVESSDTQFTGEPQIREPDKCESWQWFDWQDLPSPLFPPLRKLVDQSFLPRGLTSS